jgi:hypothetical protein
MLSQISISTSAALMLIVGAMHLRATLFGSKLRPRDPELEARMKHVPLVITDKTSMWRGWIAFNATQSLGFMLFGALYGYLSMFHFQMLLQARFVLVVGAVFLASLLVLAKRYLFKGPVVAFGACLALYVAGVVAAVA